MTHSLLSLKNVSFKIDHQSILEEISFNLHQGEFMTLVGPNGSGKTTLLRVCLGLLKPTKGQVLRGNNLSIGYMPQRLYIDKSLPINVEVFLSLSAGRDEIHGALERVGARSLLKSPLEGLSGGELQRVLLAKALLRKPDLLVLDEPLQGVDMAGQAELYDLIQRFRVEEKCAVLLVSHDLYFVHKSSDRVICLNRHICCEGHPEVVRQNPAYQTLFGLSPTFAPYSHHHDHSHDQAPDQQKSQNECCHDG